MNRCITDVPMQRESIFQDTSNNLFFMKSFDKIHLSELEPYPMPMKLHGAIKKDLFAAA